VRNSVFTRQCIACRSKKNKNQLIRLSKINDKIVINNNVGRGVYVCKNSECINLLENRNLLNRAFKYNANNENKQNIFKELREFGREQTK